MTKLAAVIVKAQWASEPDCLSIEVRYSESGGTSFYLSDESAGKLLRTHRIKKLSDLLNKHVWVDFDEAEFHSKYLGPWKV